MWTHKAVVLAAILGVLTACAESGITEPDRPFDLKPLLTITNPNKNLTAAEEAELRARAKITDTDLKVAAVQLATGDNIEVSTEATIPFKIFFPQIKHDVQYQVLDEDGTVDPRMIAGDWQLGEPQTGDLKEAFRLDFHDVSVPCEAEGSNAGLYASSEHRARWKFFKLGSILRINDGPVGEHKQDQCPRRTSTRREERSRPPNERCLVSIWYDLDTLEVLSVTTLTCWFEDDCPDCLGPTRSKGMNQEGLTYRPPTTYSTKDKNRPATTVTSLLPVAAASGAAWQSATGRTPMPTTVEAHGP